MIFLKYNIHDSIISDVFYPSSMKDYKIIVDTYACDLDILKDIFSYLRGNMVHSNYDDYNEYMYDKNIAFESSLIMLDPNLSNRAVLGYDSI